jgi:GNAT superfamily N-acetyltransferase
MPALRIRAMAPADAPRVAALLGQLGYPSEAKSVPARLLRMAGERLTVAVVAESGGQVTGLAAGQISWAIHADEAQAWLMALVVDEQARDSGIGRALVAHVEAWTKAQGAHKISLPTATRREAAHQFYEHLGYVKTGYRYTRNLE